MASSLRSPTWSSVALKSPANTLGGPFTSRLGSPASSRCHASGPDGTTGGVECTDSTSMSCEPGRSTNAPTCLIPLGGVNVFAVNPYLDAIPDPYPSTSGWNNRFGNTSRSPARSNASTASCVSSCNASTSTWFDRTAATTPTASASPSSRFTDITRTSVPTPFGLESGNALGATAATSTTATSNTTIPAAQRRNSNATHPNNTPAAAVYGVNAVTAIMYRLPSIPNNRRPAATRNTPVSRTRKADNGPPPTRRRRTTSVSATQPVCPKEDTARPSWTDAQVSQGEAGGGGDRGLVGTGVVQGQGEAGGAGLGRARRSETGPALRTTATQAA